MAAVARGAQTEVTALLSVMSTANCAPWRMGRPAATTSISRSSVAETCTFMSPQFNVAGDCCASFSAHSGQRSFCGHGTPLQPARMWTSGSVSSEDVVLATALASALGQSYRKASPLQHECPEMHGLHLELWHALLSFPFWHALNSFYLEPSKFASATLVSCLFFTSSPQHRPRC